MYNIIDKSNKKNRLYANIGKLITSSLDTKTILEKIMVEVKIYFDPQYWSLFRYDEVSGYIYFAIMEGVDFDDYQDIKLTPGEGIVGQVVSTGESIYVPDTSKDSRFSKKVDELTGFNTETIIAVPIKIKDRVYGVIEIINHENHDQFTDEDHLILQSIADFSAIAFYNNSVYEEAIKRSERDSLTGLYNKEKLKKIINEGSESKRNSDNNLESIIIYIDLDNFKNINDTYGHSEGDEVLKRVGLRLRSVFRSDDLIFRVGGDEFLILIRIEKSIDIDSVVDRIMGVLTNLKISSVKKGYSVELSFGVKRGTVNHLEELIHDADLLMYDNKKSKK